ncbi:MAG: sigma-70 family RNA polymerase sigma factor [Anaerolineales bacterium]|nr:sigma-70 family RNA polymerase sigma factor [Anaerolineales bacterium]
MAQIPHLQLLTLTGLSQRCAQESVRFSQRQDHDPRFCFELFRRAVVHRNERAWELVYRQYAPQVTRWVRRHRWFGGAHEEADYFVNRAFEKMWSALTPDKFEQFADLAALLRYLQLCVHSAITDHTRRQETAVLLPEAEEGPETPVSDADSAQSAEARVLEQLQRRALWQAIQARLNDEQERQVIYAMFVLALKPRDIPARFPAQFADVRQVYRVKENVMARLRRDDDLRQFWDGA